MVLSEVVQGGDAYARIRKLIDDSAQTDEEKAALCVARRRDLRTRSSMRTWWSVWRARTARRQRYVTTVDAAGGFRARPAACRHFCWRRSSFWIPRDESYALDVISLAEATLEDPRQVLRAQERAARDKAMAEMKADGVDYEERLERLAEVTYPRPLEDLLAAAFERYCQEVPWARDFELSPKSVAARHGGDGLGLQDLRAALQDRALGGNASALPGRRVPRARPHGAVRSPRRAAGGHRVVARLPRALGGFEPGGRVGECGFG